MTLLNAPDTAKSLEDLRPWRTKNERK